MEDAPKQQPKTTEKNSTREICCYLAVITATILVVVFIITNTMANFLVFARDKKFPGAGSFIVGTLVSIMALSCVVYYTRRDDLEQRTSLLVCYLLFLVSYIIWCTNITIAAEHHVKGAKSRTNAGYYGVFCILLLLGVFYISSGYDLFVSSLTFLPLSWCMYLLYRWWFRYTTYTN